jgi:23S rRNA pseudouridine1911/1915/1917 synthase
LDKNWRFSQLSVSDTFQWIVTVSDEGVRLDAFLARCLPSFPRRERATLIANRHVLLNGRPSTKGTIIHNKDHITVSFTTSLTPTFDMPIAILYSDLDVVVVDKPVGFASVALRHSDTQTIANFLIAHFPETAQAGSRQLEAGLVHRLDTETSGVLLAARTSQAYNALREQFRHHTIKKDYLAIVKGRVHSQGSITLPLEPQEHRGRYMKVAASGQGQAALTLYTPLEQLSECTLVRLTIVTGVRHQIRAHLAALGHPIIGDIIYGVRERQATRLYLHAEKLRFQHPRSGQTINVTSPPPADFSALLKRLRERSV